MKSIRKSTKAAIAIYLLVSLCGVNSFAQTVPANSVSGSYRVTQGSSLIGMNSVACANGMVAKDLASCTTSSSNYPWTVYFQDGRFPWRSYGGGCSDHSHALPNGQFYFDDCYNIGTTAVPVGNTPVTFVFPGGMTYGMTCSDALLGVSPGTCQNYANGSGVGNPQMDCVYSLQATASPLLAGSMPVNFTTTWAYGYSQCTGPY
jgi:hypothetical protein